jgi:hypothetical protein
MTSRRDFFGHAIAIGAAPSVPPPASSAGDVWVDRYLEPGAADDGPAIRQAIEEAIRSGRVVTFSGREYRIGSTIDLPTGIHLIGVGAVAGPGVSRTTGTILRRVRDCVLMRAQGTSFRAGGPMRHSIALRDIQFVGGDFTSDLAQFVAASRIGIDNCFFVQSKGRHLLLWEVFDSRITNTDFEWGGTAGGSVPMIELRSGGDMDYTNHVHFVGCRCEAYPGTAVALTGSNANKIFFTNCKLESGDSNDPALVISKATAVHFNGLQITARGTAGAQMAALIKARDCFGIIGDVIMEYNAWETPGARLASYIDLGNAQGVDLTLCVIDGLASLPLESYVLFDKERSAGMVVRGYVRQRGTTAKPEWRA